MDLEINGINYHFLIGDHFLVEYLNEKIKEPNGKFRERTEYMLYSKLNVHAVVLQLLLQHTKGVGMVIVNSLKHLFLEYVNIFTYYIDILKTKDSSLFQRKK